MIWTIYHYLTHFKSLVLWPLWTKYYQFCDHANQNLLPYVVILELCMLYLIVSHIVRSLKIYTLNTEQSKLVRRLIDELQQVKSRKQRVGRRSL